MSVFRKETREALRDRNLVINVLLVPLLLYPVLGFGAFQVVQILAGVREGRVSVVAVEPDTPGAIRDSLAAVAGLEVVSAAPGDWSAARFRESRDRAEFSGEAPLEALLQWSEGERGAAAAIFFDGSRERSVAARDDLTGVLLAARQERTGDAFAKAGLSPGHARPFRVERRDIASASERGGKLLSLILPITLLVMLSTGTYYTALDAVVGERERGTLETILTTPVRRGTILAGKYLFVVASSVVALVLNLASLTLFAAFILRLVNAHDEITVAITPVGAMAIVGTAVLLAAFLAAVLMLFASTAKTYREGQSILMPFYLATLIPGMMVTVSRDPFTTGRALIPVVNAVGLFKAAIDGTLSPVTAALTMGSLAVLASVALAVASRMALRESVWMDPAMTWKKLFSVKEGGLWAKS
ncbi:MAG: ABC transporter permease subunit [Gemmatimonadota bacterium]|nr:ABC transporter permease subunit [Gemmatimonadota bacterium]